MSNTGTLEIGELVAELVNRGGAIVSSADCSPREINAAREDNRFAATGDGLGFVLRLKRSKRKIVRSTVSGRFAPAGHAQTDKIGTVTEIV